MNYTESRKIIYLCDVEELSRNNEIYYHVEVQKGIDYKFAPMIESNSVLGERSDIADYTIKIGISVDDCEFILNIASIIVTAESIDDKELIQVIKSMQVCRRKDIEVYQKIADLLMENTEEANKILVEHKKNYNKTMETMEKMLKEFKELKFKYYD